MAFAVLQAVSTRLQREGRLKGSLPSTLLIPGDDGLGAVESRQTERPPLADLRAAA
jgi:hypothetical protein